jgi:ribonuclease P protein component
VKKKFRLTRPTDFQRVRRHGQSYAHPLVVLIALDNDTDKIRVGVTAGRSLGSAVNRNRAKRMLRAAISPLLPDITPGVDLALIARKPILDVKSTQVQEALTKNLSKANLLKNKS